MKSFTTVLALSTLASSAWASHHDSSPLQARHARNALKRRTQFGRRQEGVFKLAVANSTVAPIVATVNSTTEVDSTSHNGTALWFYETGSEGACKEVNSDDDVVVGLDNTFYPDPLVISPYCGQYVSITDVDSGSSVTALVADASGKEYTTLSIAAFRQLAPLSTGQLTIEWHFLADGANATSSYPSNSTSLYGNSTVSGNSTVKATVAATTVRVAVATDVATATTTTTTKDDSAAKASSAALAAASKAAAAKVAAEAAAEQAAEDAAAEKAAAEKAAAVAAAKKKAAQEAQDAADAAAAAKAKAQAEKQAAEQKAADEAAAAAAAAKKEAAQARKAAEEQAAKEKAQADAAAQAAAEKAAAQQAAAEKKAAADKKAAEQAAANSGGGGGDEKTGGFATYFFQNGVAGNCGDVSPDSMFLVALPTATYANGAHCGQKVIITRPSTGKQITAVVKDSCPTCVNNNCLDLSQGAFNAIASESEGMVPITWHFA